MCSVCRPCRVPTERTLSNAPTFDGCHQTDENVWICFLRLTLPFAIQRRRYRLCFLYHFITVLGSKLRSSLAVPSLPWRYCRKRSSDSQNLPTREIVSDQQASARQSTTPHSIPTQLSQLNYPWYSVLNSFLMICLSLRYDVDEIDDGTWETKLMLSIILVFPLSLSADGKQRRNVLQYLKRNGTVHQQTCLDLATLHIISWCVT